MRIVKGNDLSTFESFVHESRKHCFAFKLLLDAHLDGYYDDYQNEIMSLFDERVEILHDMCIRFEAFFDSLPISSDSQ